MIDCYQRQMPVCPKDGPASSPPLSSGGGSDSALSTRFEAPLDHAAFTAVVPMVAAATGPELPLIVLNQNLAKSWG